MSGSQLVAPLTPNPVRSAASTRTGLPSRLRQGWRGFDRLYFYTYEALRPKPVIVTSGRKGFMGILSRADAKILTSGRQLAGEKSSAGPTQSRFVIRPHTCNRLAVPFCPRSHAFGFSGRKTRKHVVICHTQPQSANQVSFELHKHWRGNPVKCSP